eukprot:CAMPEP_0116998590 /NCGR_PEP_ID=MMETSP0472-20121206/1610_1 /TAXON_ID=693140 ORGANISM="Tiarina fusus, Strain LIS" /NCGR_SAMPLE_ID=MMETSP0472 /ASSEMBLY_ACC=CAM_ASM_000603 /LENGTH=547 /DNA_ID=CAMNT_0004697791 /DNA_START=170 /DNA_END=1809 /DNA_ORIENTATION=+
MAKRQPLKIRNILLLLLLTLSLVTGEEEDGSGGLREHSSNDDDDNNDDDDTNTNDDENDSTAFGADISFPMQYNRIREGSEAVLGSNRQAFYENLVQGCGRAYDMERCRFTEERRIERNRNRPAAMKNFTENGFAKVATPPELWKLVQEFWKTNSFKGARENWEFGEMTVNHWDAPTYMVGLHDPELPGGGRDLERAVWDASRSTLEAWTGQTLRGCSLYGVRVYTENAILVPHVDRTPLVSSAIINVAQDTTEPWPLEVIGHDGKAHNITMEPGDMVLYESHSIIHGRPYPLKGKFYANIFVHFEPISDHEGDVPLYIDPAIAGAAMYQAMMEDRTTHYGKQNVINLEVHMLAGNGRTQELRQIVERDPKFIDAQDEMGWQPIHEAARGGHIETIHYLLERGADVNARNLHGATPMYIAASFNGHESDVVRFLHGRGALHEEPVHPNLPHALAGDGKLPEFQELIDKNPRLLQVPDTNGWTPLHEAARGGHVDVVDFLVKQGAHLNKQTAAGGTAMWYAAQHHGEDSEVYRYFKELGALQLGPEAG